MLGNETDEIIEQRLSLPFRQLMLLGQTGREMLESDWTSGHFRSSYHNFEPFFEREKPMINADMIRGGMKSWAPRVEGRPGQSVDLSIASKASYPQTSKRRKCVRRVIAALGRRR